MEETWWYNYVVYSSLHTSLVLLHRPYGWHMAVSACFKVSASLIKFPARFFIAWQNSSFLISFQADLFLHLANCGIATTTCMNSKTKSNILLPRLSAILFTSTYNHNLCWTNYDGSCSLSHNETARTSTLYETTLSGLMHHHSLSLHVLLDVEGMCPPLHDQMRGQPEGN